MKIKGIYPILLTASAISCLFVNSDIYQNRQNIKIVLSEQKELYIISKGTVPKAYQLTDKGHVSNKD